MDFHTFLLAAILSLCSLGSAQQYAGDFINNSLPLVDGTEITYFRIPDPAGKNNNLTLINYYGHGRDGNRIVESKIQRAVIVIHGLNRDPYTYESNALSALYQIANPDVNFDTVAVMAPYFPNGDDKNVGYPWTTGLAAGLGSTTNALVWPGSQWSAGGNAQYPNAVKNTISSFYVLDTLVKYFDNATLFPNVKQIVVAGHSLGAQTVQRYAVIGNQLNTRSPVTYWVGNPNSYIWMDTSRPFDTTGCSVYDVYRDGFTNFTQYPMTYATALVAKGRSAIIDNFNSKQMAYARGLQDQGDDSSNCAPFTTGANRNERFFNFIKKFPLQCSAPQSRNCDTVDLINVGHDSGQMMASPAGQARLFLDNFYGNGTRAYDMGYPRVQDGDDPFPDPSLNSTKAPWNNNTYAGNMTYYGCWSDQQPLSLPYLAYDNSSNTIEFCTQTCNSLGYSIAGVEYSSQCYCGNALSFKAQRTVEASCGMPCSANSNETCGGISRVNIFSQGTPKQLTQPVNVATIGSFKYSACYVEVPGRILNDNSISNSNMSVEACYNFCSSYKYFGLEYGSECYCGNTILGQANTTAETDCSYTCSGNSLELCGAGNRMSLYGLASNIVSTVTTASKTSATPSATPVVCPQSNNTVFTTNGMNFLVECNMDHYGGDLSYVNVNSLQDCIVACSTTKTCIDVSLSGTACYMKNSLGQGNVNTGVNGAKFIGMAGASSSSSAQSSTSATSTVPSTSSAATTTTSSVTSSSTAPITSSTTSSTTPVIVSTTSTSSAVASPSPVMVTCPTSNNTVVSTFNGATWYIECGMDHYGGDMGLVYRDTFFGCITACANTTGCVDVSLNGQACYLKSSVGASNMNGVWGARFLAAAPVSSSTPSTSSSAVISTSSIPTTSSVISTSSSVAITISSISSSTAVVVTSSIITTSSPAPTTSSIITSSTTTTSTYSSVSGYAYPTLSAGFAYAGCFQDNGARVMAVSNGSSSSMTPQKCASNCRDLGYKYSGSEYSSECYCSNYLPTQSAPDTDCSSQCSGDAKQNCGGGYRLSVITDNNWKQTLFTRQSFNSWNLQGCYADDVNARDLSNPVAMAGGNNNATIANCLTACASAGYRYCGAEYYRECYGSNTAPKVSPLPGASALAAGCDYPCAANSSEACGGNSKITIYLNGA